MFDILHNVFKSIIGLTFLFLPIKALRNIFDNIDRAAGTDATLYFISFVDKFIVYGVIFFDVAFEKIEDIH